MSEYFIALAFICGIILCTYLTMTSVLGYSRHPKTIQLFPRWICYEVDRDNFRLLFKNWMVADHFQSEWNKAYELHHRIELPEFEGIIFTSRINSPYTIPNVEYPFAVDLGSFTTDLGSNELFTF